MPIERGHLLNDEGRYLEAIRNWTERCEEEKIPVENRQRPELVLLDGRRRPHKSEPAPETWAEVVEKGKAKDAVGWQLRLSGIYLASGRIPT